MALSQKVQQRKDDERELIIQSTSSLTEEGAGAAGCVNTTHIYLEVGFHKEQCPAVAAG